MINKKSRLGIFVFYDAEGIADRYVIYLLENITTLLDDLVIVINGELKDSSREKFLHFTGNVIQRENKGYDAMAVKTAMVDFYGWEKLEDFDSVVVFNDTFYGPFFSLNTMFAEMDTRKAALWGTLCRIKDEISSSSVTVFGTYFYVMNKELLLCPEWRNYWENLDAGEWLFQDAIDKYERALIPLCEKSGFKWDAYLRSDTYTGVRKESSFDDYINIPYELIAYHGFPFLKRKPLASRPDFSVSLGDSQKRALDYIERCTNYDVGMIWENLLRKYNWWELKNALKLTQILRNDYISAIRNEKQVLLIFRIAQEEWLYDFYNQWFLYSDLCRIEVFTDEQSIYNKMSVQCDLVNKKINIHKICNEKQFVLALKQSVENFSYIFYMDDYAYKGRSNENLAIGRSVQNFIIQSLAESSNYILNIEKEFDSNSYLGVFIPASIYTNRFLGMWIHNNDEKIIELFSEMKDYLQETCNVHAFWSRREVFVETLAALQDKMDELLKMDMRAPICMLVPSIAQKLKMLTMELINENMASIVLNSQQYILKNLLKQIELNTGTINGYQDLGCWDLKLFCIQFQHIYIYGTGVWGMRILNRLSDLGIKIDGFIVSDGLKIEMEKEDHPVFELCDMKISTDHVGIIVAISKNHQQGIIKSLMKQGFAHIYTV